MKEELIKKLDGRTMTWFYSHHIEKQCGITYFTFMNQVNGRGKIRDETKQIIDDFLSKDTK